MKLRKFNESEDNFEKINELFFEFLENANKLGNIANSELSHSDFGESNIDEYINEFNEYINDLNNSFNKFKQMSQKK